MSLVFGLHEAVHSWLRRVACRVPAPTNARGGRRSSRGQPHAACREDDWFVDLKERVWQTYDGVVVLSRIELLRGEGETSYAGRGVPAGPGRELPRAVRKHLPATSLSRIYLQLASRWTDDPAAMQAVDQALRHWLTSTGRVQRIHVLLARTFVETAGHISLALPAGVRSRPTFT